MIIDFFNLQGNWSNFQAAIKGMVILIRKSYNKNFDPHFEGGKEEHYK